MHLDTTSCLNGANGLTGLNVRSVVSHACRCTAPGSNSSSCSSSCDGRSSNCKWGHRVMCAACMPHRRSLAKLETYFTNQVVPDFTQIILEISSPPSEYIQSKCQSQNCITPTSPAQIHDLYAAITALLFAAPSLGLQAFTKPLRRLAHVKVPGYGA